jgi:SAM-dependent methyltransferase
MNAPETPPQAPGIPAGEEAAAPAPSDLASLRAELHKAVNDGNFLRALIEHERGNYDAMEADRQARGAVIEEQGRAMAALHAEVHARLAELKDVYETRERDRNELNLLRSLIEHERGNVAAIERDREARGALIEEQGQAVGALHAQVDTQLKDLRGLYETRERERHERRLIQGVAEDLMGMADGDDGADGRDAFLASLRRYNHDIVDRLARVAPLEGRKVLDIGASPHGFAMERAVRHRAAEYVGIGLDMPHEIVVKVGAHAGRLLRMNAERLDLPDETFDAALSISAFEHIAHPDAALAECHRVLRRGGRCLIVFEPIWTASYGHHLHHFGEVSKVVPDWSHLHWTPAEMARFLEGAWPADAPVPWQDAVRWIYESDELNRIGIRELRRLVSRSPFEIEEVEPIREEARDAPHLDAAAAKTGLTRDELLTRGLSITLRRR